MSSALLEPGAWRRVLAPSHALWLGPTGLWDHGPVPGWRGAAPAHRAAAPQRHADFDAWCRARPGRGCTLLLSGWLLHELLLDPALPLPHDSARLAYARRLLQHYHGEPASQWPLAAWQAQGSRGVSALHSTTLAALQTSAHRHGVALRGLRPWWSAALAIAARRQPALLRCAAGRLLVVDGALVTQIELRQGRVQQLLQRQLGAPTPDALRHWHAGLPASPCSLAIGHGLRPAWTGSPGDALQALGPLDGETPAVRWAGQAQPAEAAAA